MHLKHCHCPDVELQQGFYHNKKKQQKCISDQPTGISIPEWVHM